MPSREQTLRELIENTTRALEAGDSEAQVPLLRAWVGEAQGWDQDPDRFLHEHPSVVTADPLTVRQIRGRLGDHPRERHSWIDPGVDDIFPSGLLDDDFVAFALSRCIMQIASVPDVTIRDAARSTALRRTDLSTEGRMDVMDDFIQGLMREVMEQEAFVIETVALWKALRDD
jgi:hypothetical protein